MQKTIQRYVVGIPLLIPSAVLFALYISSVIWGSIVFILRGSNVDSLPSQVYLAALLATWVVCSIWASATDSVRRTIARTCWAFSTAAFLLPIAGLVTAIFSPPDPPDTFFPKWFVVVVLFIVGVPLGTLEAVLAIKVSPRGSPEESGEIFLVVWNALRRIGVARLAIMAAVLIIGLVTVRIISPLTNG